MTGMLSNRAIWRTIAQAHLDKHRPDAAQLAFLHALAEHPDDAATHVARATSLFHAGDYAAGWAEFEWRHYGNWAQANNWSVTQRNLQAYGPLSGKKTGILVCAEGGLGDTIQFARFVPLLRQRLPDAPIVFEVQNPLVELIKTFPGMDSIEVLPRTMPHPQQAQRKISPPLDARINSAEHLLSLPFVLGLNDPRHFPAPSFPVQPPLTINGPLKIGLCWRADPNNKFDQGRDVPLPLLLPLINTKGVVVTSLLDDVTPAERALAPNLRLPNPHGERVSFTEMANLIRQQDLIISADTVWPNLAATLGKPVQMLTLKTPNWRWGLTGETTPWYPSMKLARQTQHGDWTGPVNFVTQLVRAGAAARSAVPQQRPRTDNPAP
jgi:hypothetical protein